jgi:hypothetical protein
VTNCTFSENTASVGGGMYNHESSTPTVTNCILWGNADGGGMDESAQIHDTSGAASVVTYSDVQGGWTGAGGTGNINGDALFVDADGGDNIPGTEDDNLRLGIASPAIDAGDNTAVPPDAGDLDGDGDTSEPIPFDLDGNPRFVDDPGVPDTGVGPPPIVDMGAYEAHRCSNDSECDDGLFCNGLETCQTGLCQPGSDPCPGQQCDGTNDECFTPPPSPQPAPPDEDGDSVPDSSDNCPGTTAGAEVDTNGCSCDQLDDDGDGVDDCLDNCPADPAKIDPGICGCGTPDSLDDGDGDGVIDCLDNCPTTANPDQADGDGNGVGDACESGPTGCCGCGAGSTLLMPLMLTGMGWMRRRQAPRRR